MNIPDSAHYSFETIGSTYRFVFPYRKEWFHIISYLVSVVVLLVVILPSSGLVLLSSGQTDLNLGFILFGVFLLVIGGLVLVELLWQLAGREVAEIGDDAVVLKHQILGLGPSKKFPAEKISGLAVSQDNRWASYWLSGRDYRFFNFKRGRVALNSGKSLLGQPVTYRFGTILTDDEAAQVVGLIVGRFPQYKIEKPHA
jgi:hypothetical protein